MNISEVYLSFNGINALYEGVLNNLKQSPENLNYIYKTLQMKLKDSSILSITT